LPERNAIHQRLTELLSIGVISAPQIGGKFYLYTKREGSQNQPVLFVREGLQGKDRALVDVNALAPDGTVALDWWQVSEDGKYVAYGTSPSGSEISTLRVIETETGNLLPDAIERTRAASVAWKLDDSGFYYTRYPEKGTVPEGQENYNRHVFYHALGSDAAKDALIFGQGRDPQDWPDVDVSNDGRWLLITVEVGWTKSELYLQDLQANTPAVRITEGKEFLYSGEIVDGKVFITTNENAPRYHAFVADVTSPGRANWKEIIPESDTVLQGVSVVNGLLLAQYEKNATSQLKLFDRQGRPLGEIQLPAIGTVFGLGGKWNRKETFFAFQSFTIPDCIYQIDLQDHKTSLWSKVDAFGIDPARYEVQQVWFNSKDGTRVPMSCSTRKVCSSTVRTQRC
jgi:prolyl oligopeptidase